jgi:hypothetical protein
MLIPIRVDTCNYSGRLGRLIREEKHMRLCFAIGALATVLGTTPALAQSCQDNFQVEGVALITAMNFRTSQNFPGLDQRKAVSNLRSAMLAEGFSNIAVDNASGSLTAVQESSGSGRPQTLRITARKAGSTTRVDAVFMIQPGQVADANTVRTSMCRVLAGARL